MSTAQAADRYCGNRIHAFKHRRPADADQSLGAVDKSTCRRWQIPSEQAADLRNHHPLGRPGQQPVALIPANGNARRLQRAEYIPHLIVTDARHVRENLHAPTTPSR